MRQRIALFVSFLRHEMGNLLLGCVGWADYDMERLSCQEPFILCGSSVPFRSLLLRHVGGHT